MVNWLRQNALALIGPVVTVLALIVGTLTVIWQLGRQHKSALKLQRDNARETLKLRIYEKLAERIRTLSDANGEASMYVFAIPGAIENFQRQLSLGFQSPPIGHRAPTFSALHSKASLALAELIIEFESWSIAFPDLWVFQVALNYANDNARDAFMSLFSALIRALPMEPPEGPSPTRPTIVQPPLTDAEFSALWILVAKYKEAMDEVGCFIHDLRIEAQNNLLSGLFDRKVPPRQPLDPNRKVISTEPQKMKELLDYFLNETSWGKAHAAMEEEVRAAYRPRETKAEG